MQNILYIDTNFIKENSLQYILSIRYATDGLSFCIHDQQHRLLAFSHQPYNLENNDAMIAKVKNIIAGEELLGLKYQKVYIISCNKDKILVPAYIFSPDTINDLYRVALDADKNSTLIHRKVQIAESFLIEAVPRNFVTFLANRYQTFCIVNSAYPFIIQSLSGILFNTHHLFIDIHDHYFDLLLTQNNNIRLFNSFIYQSVNDIIYYALNCLKQCHINKENLQTVLSGNLVNDPILTNTLGNYLPNISVLNYAPLSQLVKNDELNNSIFIHLLNIHKCE